MFKKNSVQLSKRLLADLTRAFEEIEGWGSVEVYVQGGKITQITKRAIKKTNHQLRRGS